MTSPAFKRLPVADVYRNLYPWRNLDEFVAVLTSPLAYKNEDSSLIAINKPFGVGIYTAKDNNVSKQNQDRILSSLPGDPKYCISDALDSITDHFNSTQPYKIIKGLDRYMSGLVLISNDYKTYRSKFEKSLVISKAQKSPPYGLRVITSGYPKLAPNEVLTEKVGVKLIEVDEFGDYKEPLVVQNPSSLFQQTRRKDVAVFNVEMKVKAISQEYATSLTELYVSRLIWDFPRVYISSKTSFILGDVRFSNRVREVLGKKIMVSAFKSSRRHYDGYEPLNEKLQKHLGVYKNASIPLMMDLFALRLKGFNLGKKDRDLIIQSNHMPLHFALTASKLDLLEESGHPSD